MSRLSNSFWSALLILVLSCGVAAAQSGSTAQINGTVTDQSGAILPGVEVTVRQTATGLARNVVSDETGYYTAPNLPIGPYMLEAALPGFRTYVRTGIVLQVNSNPVINVTLEVGALTEQIEVRADAAMVETRNTGIGQVMETQRVLELPLNGRQVTELIFLAGMANTQTSSNQNLETGGARNYPTVVLSIGGGLPTGTNYVLDGGTHNDPFNNQNLPLPFPDALAEFKVESSGLAAQYGHHSGGQVNLVTKSGTNEFHGDLFEFVRNAVLNARNARALSRDELKRNQFGGVIGGPIVRNKTFFFAGYQGTTQRSAPTTGRGFVPTAEMLAGDFTTVASTACRTSPITLAASQGFAGNKIDPSRFVAPALALVKRLPSTTDPCGEVRFGSRAISDEHIMLGRVDHQLNNKHSLVARYEFARFDTPTDYDGKNPLSLSNGPQVNRVQSFVLGHTHLIASGTSSFRATLNRTKIEKQNVETFDWSDLGVNAYVPIPKLMLFSVSAGFSIGGTPTLPGKYNTTSFQFAEDMNIVRGKHQIGLGGEFVNQQFNSISNMGATGTFVFGGQITNLGLADFLLGKVSSFSQGNPRVNYNRSNFLGAYVQDSWRAARGLMVNAGIRWEPYLPIYSKRRQVTHFDPELFAKGVHSSVFTKAPAGLLFPGDSGMPNRFMGFPRWLDFAPRMGIAWDPQGKGQMTIRAAYGLFFDQPHLWLPWGFSQSPPFGSTINLTTPRSFADPWIDYPGGNPFPFTPTADTPFPLQSQFLTHPLHPKHVYANQWNLSVQRAIGTDWMASVNYIGNNLIHMTTSDLLDPGVYIPGNSTLANLPQRRVLYLQNPQEGQYYGKIDGLKDDGTSSYSAGMISIQRRRSKGLTIQANYTWSHCVADYLDPFVGGPAGRSYMVPGDRRRDRANCGSDRRHTLNTSTVYETPMFSNPAVRAVAGGWRVSGILRIQTGTWLTPVTGLDNALSGQQDQRPNQTLLDVYAAGKNDDLWINAAAYAQPATGTYGNAGRLSVLGPGSIRIDMGLTRTFHVRENQTVDLRVEAFNVPNHVNPGNPNTTLNNQNFGRILSAGDPRLMQVGLKYAF
jgi:hypothetical protein